MTRNNPSLKKRFGQHHLRSGELCRPLVDYLQPAGRPVVEIGAGGGVLTAALSAAGGRVVACEVDLDWVFELRRRFFGKGPRILALDALEVDWSRFQQPVVVAGNLPFNVGTRLIEKLLPHFATVTRAAFMVQKEVAERMVAEPGDSAYGSFSLLVAAQARARYLGTVHPASFKPPPKVTAAYVGLELMAPPVPPEQMPQFVRLLRLAFAMRRKTLRNSLASGVGKAAAGEVLAAAGLDDRSRAQNLDLAAFVRLYRACRGIADL